jgi:hypothetical protein
LEARPAQRRVGWQPSRFLTDCAEAGRAFALAERLGTVNAAAAEVGTTWPSLRKASTPPGMGCGMPTRNLQAVQQRAAEAARQRSGWPATLSPIRCLWPSTTATSPSGRGRVGSWPSGSPRRGLRGPGCPGGGGAAQRKPRGQASTRAWAITRRGQRAHHRHQDRQQRGDRHHADRTSRPDRPHQERGMVADAR